MKDMKRNSNSRGVKQSNDLRATCKLQESIGNILDNLRSSSQLGKAEHPSLKAHHQFQGRCATHFLGNEASWCALGLTPGIIGILRKIRRFAHCAKMESIFEALWGHTWYLLKSMDFQLLRMITFMPRSCRSKASLFLLFAAFFSSWYTTGHLHYKYECLFLQVSQHSPGFPTFT
jgi:hypothetical protein